MNVADFLLEKCKSIDKDFVVGTEETISYKEFCSKVNALAAYLNNKFGSGKEIMLLSENNIFFIISYLSIIKSNNIVILLEAKVSKKDLDNILNLCSIKGFFIQDKFKSKLKVTENIFTESMVKDLIENKKDILLNKEECKIDTKDDDLAEIIFTSGSTGDKKGVMLSHKNIIANTKSIIEYLTLTENDRMEGNSWRKRLHYKR